MATSLFAAVPAMATAQAEPTAASKLARARELFNEGMDRRDAGDLPGALERLHAADALAGVPITRFELGRTYQSLGRLVEALDAFASVAKIPRQPGETARSTSARSESAKLAEQVRSRIPTLTIQVTGVPERSVTVTIDGVEISPDAWSSPHPLDPGTHDVHAASGERSADVKVDLDEAEVRTLTIPIEAPERSATPPTPSPPPAALSERIEPVPPSTPAAPSAGGAQRVLGLVVGGVGVAGLVAGGIVGLVAKSQDRAAANEPFPAKHDDSLGASRLADTATVVVVAGATGAALGAILWLTAPHARAAVGTDGSEVWFRGTF